MRWIDLNATGEFFGTSSENGSGRRGGDGCSDDVVWEDYSFADWFGGGGGGGGGGESGYVHCLKSNRVCAWTFNFVAWQDFRIYGRIIIVLDIWLQLKGVVKSNKTTLC